jgi:hypothetical protein
LFVHLCTPSQLSVHLYSSLTKRNVFVTKFSRLKLLQRLMPNVLNHVDILVEDDYMDIPPSW